nr:aminotransferase class I/II-fold pyridoxal phosphate-dependent enzyme [Geomicrobium sp. JCM 19038]
MLPSSAKRMTNVEFSKIREISAKAAERANAGHDVFRLTLGEPDFDTPAIAQAAAFEAIKAGDTHYTPNTGIQALREALASKLLNENGIPAKAEEIIVTNGGSEALLDTFLALLNPGDEVMIRAQLGRTMTLPLIWQEQHRYTFQWKVKMENSFHLLNKLKRRLHRTRKF